MIKSNPGSVRPAWILILVLKLGIGSIKPDCSCFCDLPFDHSRFSFSGTYKIALYLQVAAVKISVLLFVKDAHIAYIIWVISITFLIEPAVFSLFAKVIFNICVVFSCIISGNNNVFFGCGAGPVKDCNIECAAIVRRISSCINHKV